MLSTKLFIFMFIYTIICVKFTKAISNVEKKYADSSTQIQKRQLFLRESQEQLQQQEQRQREYEEYLQRRRHQLTFPQDSMSYNNNNNNNNYNDNNNNNYRDFFDAQQRQQQLQQQRQQQQQNYVNYIQSIPRTQFIKQQQQQQQQQEQEHQQPYIEQYWTRRPNTFENFDHQYATPTQIPTRTASAPTTRKYYENRPSGYGTQQNIDSLNYYQSPRNNKNFLPYQSTSLRPNNNFYDRHNQYGSSLEFSGQLDNFDFAPLSAQYTPVTLDLQQQQQQQQTNGQLDYYAEHFRNYLRKYPQRLRPHFDNNAF